MKAGAALVLTDDPSQAAREAVEQARAGLGEEPPAFAVLFASQHFHVSAQALLAAVTEQLGPLPLIGCVAESVAGGPIEAESEAAVSLWLAAGVGPVETFAMEFVRTSSGGAFGGYRFEPDRTGVCLLISDPFTFPAEYLLTHLNENAGHTQVMGGMASGGLGAQRSRLFLDGRILNEGAVGAYLPDARIHPLVSQGCRPIGDPFTVTAAEGSLVQELGGQPAMTRLQDLAASLSAEDRELLAQGVQVGIVIDEYGSERRQGDFLIRGILGAQPETGAIAVGDEVDIGQTLQFHVRDAGSADQELRRLLEQETKDLGGQRAAGALLFTCNGRGARLFPQPNHDTGLIAEVLGGIPLAGFFCAGELGPVGGQNYVHTFTASIALFPGQ
ncbi:MAG TPA: FIST N-terminal domain-containing protein [Streptosporangiaceae bacterium]|nr:FIST N-terminal domain-containing protein [Streptosporangiaceae bacterium]